jgi:hypothetical protein
MREGMFNENVFEAAVFIGGAGGILDEYDPLTKIQPSVELVPNAHDRRGDPRSQLGQHRAPS